MPQQVADDDLATLRASVSDATRRAAETTGENDKLKARIGQEVAARVAADEVAAANALAAAESAASAAEAAIATAGGASDWSALAKAQRALATAQSQIDAWTGQKTRIENWKKAQVAKAAEPPPQATYTPATAAWLAAHPEVASDPSRMMRATGAHFLAVAEGLVPESKEYFEFVEEKIGLKPAAPAASNDQRAAAGEQVAAEEPVSVAAEETPAAIDEATIAAAPSRRTPSASRAAPAGSVRLSAEQQEAARISRPDLKPAEAYKEYATNIVRLQQEGRLAS